jgi:hypothetical protein
VVIRIKCPQCDKTIKVPDDKAGSRVYCPRCGEPCMARPDDSAPAAGPAAREKGSSDVEGPGRCAAPSRGGPPELFWGVRAWEWAAVAVAAGVGVLGLLLPAVAGFLPDRELVAARATPWAVVLVPSSLLALLVILHGHATGCPSCGRWWARRRVQKEFVGREVFDKDGVPFARATYRTTYECASCGHRWSASQTDEYKDFVRSKRPRRGLG